MILLHSTSPSERDIVGDSKIFLMDSAAEDFLNNLPRRSMGTYITWIEQQLKNPRTAGVPLKGDKLAGLRMIHQRQHAFVVFGVSDAGEAVILVVQPGVIDLALKELELIRVLEERRPLTLLKDTASSPPARMQLLADFRKANTE
ncbi:MAG TPA: hypothetical protein VD907_04755 [Verrucomicrobiae bacterium]|nr:hypothetical protein [Verrucomicrobiae bacterium]